MVWYYKLLGGNIGLRPCYLLASCSCCSAGTATPVVGNQVGGAIRLGKGKEKGFMCLVFCLFVCLKQESSSVWFSAWSQRVFLAQVSGKSTLAWRGNEQQRVKGEQQLLVLGMLQCTLISAHDLQLISTCEKCSNTFQMVGFNLCF